MTFLTGSPSSYDLHDGQGSPNPVGSLSSRAPLGSFPWPAWPPLTALGSTVSSGPLGPLALSTHQDTPRDGPQPVFPQLGRRRSSLLAGLGSLGSHPHRGNSQGPTAADGARRRSVAKQRRDDHPVPDTGTAAIPEVPVLARSSALFSPYSPLPAIGGVASPSPSPNGSPTGGMRGDESGPDRHGAPLLPLAGLAGPTRLLRERTYDVLEPRFVRGPVPVPAVSGMIEDEELPVSPPAIDDEDLRGADLAGTSPDTAAPDREGREIVLGLRPLAETSQGSRSLHALKEGYKGRLKKFWSKF